MTLDEAYKALEAAEAEVRLAGLVLEEAEAAESLARAKKQQAEIAYRKAHQQKEMAFQRMLSVNYPNGVK